MKLARYIDDRIKYMLNNPHSTKGYPKTAEGNPCVLNDPSVTTAYPTIYGNSVQDGTPTPESPIEIQSVGDLVTDENDENYGKYLVPIGVRGKNLAIGEIIAATRSTDGILRPNSLNSALNTLVEVKPLTTYTLQAFGASYGGLRQYYYRENSQNSLISTELVMVKEGTSEITFTIPADCHYWSFQAGSNPTLQSKDWQLEEGDIGTAYEPYFTPQTVNLYLDEPLRKVGENADYIDWRKGVIKRFASESSTETPIVLPKLPIQPHLTNYISVDTAVKGDFTIKYHSFTKEE